jgi:hypothetical protein
VRVALVVEFGLLQRESRANRIVGRVAALAGREIRFNLPAGELQIQIQMADRRRLVVDLSGDGRTSCEFNLKRFGAEFPWSFMGGGGSEGTTRRHLEFRNEITDDVEAWIQFPAAIVSPFG